MRIISRDEIITHSRIDATDENEYIDSIGQTAEDIIESALNRSWDEVCEENDGVVPTPLHQACLMMADHLYTHRSVTENVQFYNVPGFVGLMIKKYVKLV